MGIEVRDKTLGVVGLGRVGSEVARRARAFGMNLVGYDPFISPDHAERMGVELMSVDDLLACADFITLHTPLTENTNGLIGERELKLVKPGARLINVARGELINDKALLDALNNDQLAAAALDVFVQEPPEDMSLVQHPNVIATPHLGASTEEAQREVAIEAAEQVLAILEGRPARNTVNAPVLPPDVHAILEPYIPVATLLGKLLINLTDDQLVGVTVSYEGEIAEYDTTILKSAVLEGLLSTVSSEEVNIINAPLLAQSRGLRITEQKDTVANEFTSLITVAVKTTKGDVTLAGTSLRNEPHIVKLSLIHI